MAPSSQSEDALDMEQVILQEAPLPPPIQQVMDPGQFVHAVVLENCLFSFLLCPYCFIHTLFFQVSPTLKWHQ